MHTCTSDSISTVAIITDTSEATRGVGTDSIRVTVISTSGTLINICNQISTESMCPRPGELLTHTGESISTVALVTGTGEATRGVGTDSISVTIMSTSGTLIIIWNI